jgi:DNA-directed RNA polymerase subunit RPC12/RpoP
MTQDIFEALSHTDFLKLTLEAFSRQGYEVERSSASGADGVLVARNGARIALLCKKYRGAFIGRPVLQQFYGAMGQTGCGEGYLITTTDCSPDAYEFAKGKGIELYNRGRTTELLRTAFGDEFILSGRMPELGAKARTIPAAPNRPVSVPSYEKVAVPETKYVREPEPPPAPLPASEPERPPEAVKAWEPEGATVAEAAPKAGATTESVTASEQGTAPPEEMAGLDVPEEVPEEVEAVESIEAPGSPEAPSSENRATITCAECNHQLSVPTDQGMLTITCPECGSRWLYQPETAREEQPETPGEEEVKATREEEAKTTTIITCPTCLQQLNVPTNRGQLNVRCPKCGAKWLFTP